MIELAWLYAVIAIGWATWKLIETYQHNEKPTIWRILLMLLAGFLWLPLLVLWVMVVILLKSKGYG